MAVQRGLRTMPGSSNAAAWSKNEITGSRSSLNDRLPFCICSLSTRASTGGHKLSGGSGNFSAQLLSMINYLGPYDGKRLFENGRLHCQLAVGQICWVWLHDQKHNVYHSVANKPLLFK